MPYDPWNTHTISESVANLEAVEKHQNLQFRRGDILLLRVGFIQKYYSVAQSERDGLRGGRETYCKFCRDRMFAFKYSD